MKHTPGPWTMNAEEGEPVLGANGTHVAEILDAEDADTQNANVALICAAPDLLAALRLYFTHPERFHKAASDAIAKAEGGAS